MVKRKENNMFKQRAFFVFVLCTALLGGCGSFFVYKAIFGVPVLAIIIGVVVAIFIAFMEVLFVINMLDEMKYQLLQRDLIIESLKKRRPRSQWHKHIFWWITQ